MAYGIRSQKFCCCLPVRIGVFLLSLLQSLSAAAVAGLVWYVIVSHKGNFDSKQKIAAIIIASFMS